MAPTLDHYCTDSCSKCHYFIVFIVAGKQQPFLFTSLAETGGKMSSYQSDFCYFRTKGRQSETSHYIVTKYYGHCWSGECFLQPLCTCHTVVTYGVWWMWQNLLFSERFTPSSIMDGTRLAPVLYPWEVQNQM